MHEKNLAWRAKPQSDPAQELDAWVIPGCGSLHDFLNRGLQAVPQTSGAACSNGEQEGEVLVIRGFDNLLHYLDWLDAQAMLATRMPGSGSKN
ncbi:MAG: hypothetical protein RL748_3408 [Pseudomonadota bacterium]|jgi:hypothetical protein